MDKNYTTKSYKETQKLGVKLAKEILKLPLKDKSLVLALRGNLGGGKTTFLQGFAKGLGIKEKILSPTFVILKCFKITKSQISNPKSQINSEFENFYHLDCYRLKNEKDILELDFEKIISEPKNIVVIEWPEKIVKVLPKNMIEINFNFIDENKREINFKM